MSFAPAGVGRRRCARYAQAQSILKEGFDLVKHVQKSVRKGYGEVRVCRARVDDSEDDVAWNEPDRTPYKIEIGTSQSRDRTGFHYRQMAGSNKQSNKTHFLGQQFDQPCLESLSRHSLLEGYPSDQSVPHEVHHGALMSNMCV